MPVNFPNIDFLYIKKVEDSYDAHLFQSTVSEAHPMPSVSLIYLYHQLKSIGINIVTFIWSVPDISSVYYSLLTKSNKDDVCQFLQKQGVKIYLSAIANYAPENQIVLSK